MYIPHVGICTEVAYDTQQNQWHRSFLYSTKCVHKCK